MKSLEDTVVSFVETYAVTPKDIADGKELGYDPATQPWQFKLAKHLRDTGARIGGLDWGPDAENYTDEQRAKVVYETFFSTSYETLTNLDLL